MVRGYVKLGELEIVNMGRGRRRSIGCHRSVGARLAEDRESWDDSIVED